VLARYNRKQETKAMLSTFIGGHYYHEDGSRAPTTPTWDWYSQLVLHAVYYVHPFWCFWNNPRNGENGFTCGNLLDDDLPLRMNVPISKGTHVLYTLLQKCKFPDNSDVPQKNSSLPWRWLLGAQNNSVRRTPGLSP
jgi:hypothetical protein